MADALQAEDSTAEDIRPSLTKTELKRRRKALHKEKKAAERPEDLHSLQEVTEIVWDFAMEFYGPLPLHQSQTRPRLPRAQISSFPALERETVLFRARAQASRPQGSKMVFLNLRQRSDSVQALVIATPGKVSKQMVKWAASLADESIVLVQGLVRKSPEPVRSASVQDVEVLVFQIHLVSGIEGRLPFSLEAASSPDGEEATRDNDRRPQQFDRVLLDARLRNRVLDLRTPTNQAVFKLQSAICDLFREFLNNNGFLEIHTPKLQGPAAESGASVFRVSYFKGTAFLAQSPQLAKQMAIAADFERIYEIGPVFRAEDANAHRHLAEFMGLDLEMTIEEHYHEVVELLDSLFLSIFRGLRERYSNEIAIVRKQFPADEFRWKEGAKGTLKLTFRQAIDMLVEDGVPREILMNLNTENEQRLGRLVKAKYDTDFFIVDKYPMELRPFYTMPDPEDPTLSNSYDFFMRGEKVLSGAQHIHDLALLAEKMRDGDIDPNSMKAYLDGFRMGCALHGGGGIGLERVLMLFLKLNNIRRASMFPRDPGRLDP
ncbi:hypothetical protein C8R45DRAFT_290382 [Mycena sanguinolenta]|nr:hypothetical protein C8R45DRAFT_290382 [Mycena sanguinolenta]